MLVTPNKMAAATSSTEVGWPHAITTAIISLSCQTVRPPSAPQIQPPETPYRRGQVSLEVFKSLALSDHERPLPRSWLTTCKTVQPLPRAAEGHAAAHPHGGSTDPEILSPSHRE